ncbi:PAS domain S-box protein [Ramlibacter tataouinensis]|uniref:two-component system sensor histidine kinase NtrB n=1 Tax=Ramlibacter tataouinensis TaxID=94132 RepID=UPI0022F3CDEE|nr:ATP-binding protein [Ramlibacter tataouinensis]WBY00128.1 PAS domain S-box protein [Ramlibacter tataouinensis]
MSETAGAGNAPPQPRAAGLPRWGLWVLLVALVAILLSTLVWLAGRYEASQLQSRLERDAAEAVSDLRSGLTRNVQSLQALQAGPPSPQRWIADAQLLLHERRELLRIEWRNELLQVQAFAETPYRRVPAFVRTGRDDAQVHVVLACANAERVSGPGYGISYFLPQPDGQGLEVMELCLPQVSGGEPTGFVIATYALGQMLSSLVGPQLTRGQDVSFTEADGTRLAMHGGLRRGTRMFTAQQLLDLPGNPLVLRMDDWRAEPDLFPNVLTALVTTMSIALLSVLFLLGKDMRRRLQAEHDLAEALAFRKAMEDSLVTGLRARDLAGRITYVNPAFCAMVGFSAEELLGHGTPAPYWPPERAGEYQQRQEVRLAGRHVPPREGFESVFMRKDGSRFPVLIIEAPLINAQGVQTGWMSAFLDISEQRRVEELSRASQERLQATARLATVGEMASLLSHELNQPLAAISSYATGSLNLLSSGGGGAPAPADLQLALRRIAEQAERAGKVIKSVHDFIRRREQAREPVAPRALIDAVMPLVTLQARKLGVRVETRIEPGLPPVLCDRTMVEQVLLNLARNAMQAMDEAGVARPSLLLQVRWAKAGDGAAQGWLAFSVADQGPGIPAPVRERLFTPFFTTKAEGMGLGLSMCRTVIEQHGGSLAYESNRPRGTIFRFTLPTAAAEPAAPSGSRAATTA